MRSGEPSPDKPSKSRGAALTARFASAAIESRRTRRAAADRRRPRPRSYRHDHGREPAARRRIESTRLENFARRRLAGEPVARILGHQGILGTAAQALRGNAGAAAGHRNSGRAGAGAAARRAAFEPPSTRIADLGTGSGAILLALLSRIAGRARRRDRHQRGGAAHTARPTPSGLGLPIARDFHRLRLCRRH